MNDSEQKSSPKRLVILKSKVSTKTVNFSLLVESPSNIICQIEEKGSRIDSIGVNKERKQNQLVGKY